MDKNTKVIDILIVVCAVCILIIAAIVLYRFLRPDGFTQSGSREQTKKQMEEIAEASQDDNLAYEENVHKMKIPQININIQQIQTDLNQARADAVYLEMSDEEIAALIKGKTFSILGDSISTYEGYIPSGYVDFYPMNGEVRDVEETWWKMLINETGMELCANGSSAGSTCVGDSMSTDEPKYACGNYRIGDLIGSGGVFPDIIIVYMGTNDLLTGVPLGENDGTQPVEEGMVETFSDAYSLILDKLESQYPDTQIFCATLPQIGDWGVTRPFETFVNSRGLTSEDYDRQIEIIAGNKGFNTIDLLNCGITIDNMLKYITDGVHPNSAGMKLIRDAVKAAVIKEAIKSAGL